MLVQLYVRRGIAYIPTLAQTEAGFWLDVKPVEVVSKGLPVRNGPYRKATGGFELDSERQETLLPAAPPLDGAVARFVEWSWPDKFGTCSE